MEGDDETFDDYIETTVPIGQTLPLLVTGITTLLLFVPVVLELLRPAKEINEVDDDEKDDDAAPSSIRINPSDRLVAAESIALLPCDSAESSGYGGTSLGRQSDYNKEDDKVAKPQMSPDSILPRRNSPDSGPRKAISASTTASYDEIDEDEHSRSNAVRFSDPSTSALEKLKIVTLHNFDAQTKAMFAIGFPYLIQAILSLVSEMVQMAIVGHQLGIHALSAYVVIDLFVKLTSNAASSVITSGNTMISQLVEAEDKNRAYKIGSYLQLSILFFVLGIIPLMVFWSFFTEDILLFLKIDPDMAEEGQRFVIPFVLSICVDGIASSVQEMLDVVGFPKQSTVLSFVGHIFTVGCIVVVMCDHTLFPNTTLTIMGWAYVFIDICYLMMMFIVIYLNGWLEEYYEGLFSSPFSIFQNSNDISGKAVVSKAAVKLMLSNAAQYAFSDLLFQGEWHILVLFASALGPAELAAWGILGVIWEELEYIVSAIADGCEVRVAATLGKGDIKTAKLVTYKAIWICFGWGVFVSIIFRLFEDQIPRLITTDPLLQEIVTFNLPMISLANLVSGIAIMAGHALWCQNRATLETVITTGTSTLITIPLAAISSYLFHFNLIGQTAAVAIGAAVFAAWAMYAIVSSDWEQISKNVIALHASEDSDSESDSESESESCSQSDSGSVEEE